MLAALGRAGELGPSTPPLAASRRLGVAIQCNRARNRESSSEPMTSLRALAIEPSTVQPNARPPEALPMRPGPLGRARVGDRAVVRAHLADARAPT
ncbi:MAG: hypothetical protein IPJ28_11090 [Betaproteobacteria bacterium]|nr:hypothetical protein [Betaproteobacteria bacterium]